MQANTPETVPADLRALKGYYVKKMGQNRGAPRVWLEGTQALMAGFTPGQRFDIRVKDRTVVLQANPDGSRVVSGKRIGERDNPVIDINSRDLLAVFDGMAAVRVVVKEGEIALLPLASEIKKQQRYQRMKDKLQSGEPLAMGSLFHGIGVLSHAVHAGLNAAGVPARLAAVNEIEEHLIEHAREHNDAWSADTQLYSSSVSELAFDQRGLASLPKLDILEAGIPCTGASRAGKAKRGLAQAESHPDVGHLLVSTLIIIGRTEPAVVILENVPDYAHSASADILRLQLRDLGYVTHERILRGQEWNTLEARNRWCMVAVTQGIQFDFDQLLPPAHVERSLGDVLEPIAPDDPRWSPMSGLKAKMVRDAAKGSSFKMQIFTAEDPTIATVTKGYAKVRSTDPKIAHPTSPDLLRQLTPKEHARVKEIPEHLIAGLSATVAHEGLGQSIVYPPFKDVGQHVGNALNRFAGRESVSLQRTASDAPLWESQGGPVPDAISEIAADVMLTMRLADRQVGRYVGPIVMLDDTLLIQDIGGNAGVVHRVEDLQTRALQLGSELEAHYRDGLAHCTVRACAPSLDQLALFDADEPRRSAVAVNSGQHHGRVVAVHANEVVQDAGRGRLIAHDLAGFDQRPRIGDQLEVAYRGGVMVVKNRTLEPERGGVSR